MKLKKLNKDQFTKKTILLRVDFNVALAGRMVQDKTRIMTVLPFLVELVKAQAKVILIAHLGRPNGRRLKVLSLEPVFEVLRAEKILKKYKLEFRPEKVGAGLVKKVKDSQANIILLENIRFDKEDDNDFGLARNLASMADLFINDAFAAAHRKMASNFAITKLLPSFAGQNLSREVENLEKALRPERTAVLILGGAKIETKLPLIVNLRRSYDWILTGGGIVNTLLKAKGNEVGGSLVDDEQLKQAKGLLKIKKLILPKDVVVTDKKTKMSSRIVVVGKEKNICEPGEMIVDIGPQTMEAYSQYLLSAKTIVWNGPLGLLENERFFKGTNETIKAISRSQAFSVAGGGETILAINLAKAYDKFSFVSDGGGAMLEFLAGKKLPGIEALR